MHLEGGCSLHIIFLEINFFIFYLFYQGACISPPPWEHPLQCPRQGGDGGDHHHCHAHDDHHHGHNYRLLQVAEKKTLATLAKLLEVSASEVLQKQTSNNNDDDDSVAQKHEEQMVKTPTRWRRA